MGLIEKLLGTSEKSGSSLTDEFEFSRVVKSNNNNNSSQINNPSGNPAYKPAPPASSSIANSHRRAHSDAMPVQRPFIHGNKAATLAAPRPTRIALPRLDMTRVSDAIIDNALSPAQTPGMEESPFEFYLRTQASGTKVASLPTGIKPPQTPNDLEKMLYNNPVAPLSPDHDDSSLADWEKLKVRLRNDQRIIEHRISRSFSQSDDGSGLESDHYWYKPSFKRSHAEDALRGTPPGSFLVRRSSESGSYALSVLSKELGITHLLIKPSMGLWRLTGETTASKEFSNIPELIKFYKSNLMPVKGITPFRLR